MTGPNLGDRPAAVLDGHTPAPAPGLMPELTLTASHRRAADRLQHRASRAAGPLAAADRPVVPGPAPAPGRPGDWSGAWLRNAMAGLAVLAAAAAVVSFQAQYHMIARYKHQAAVAAVQAGIPDAAALVFASLGIALALHGRRALRARALNVAAVATSVGMNALAAAPGWRAVAVWVLPLVAYALASDTLIGVVRAWVLARQRAGRERLAGEEAAPLAVLGGLVRWLLRLVLAPGSTLAGFRAWVVAECPVAPGRRGPRAGSKTHRFLALVAERHGPVGQIPPGEVSRICTALAPQAGLDTGAARTALRRAVLAAREGRPL
jgi:hypothetical protein